MIGDAAKFFNKNLEDFEPAGRAPCLCGSGEKFKNCCKEVYRNYNYTERPPSEETSRQALRRIRAHITWYRLCHQAHTKILMQFDRAKGLHLAEIDAAALDDLIGVLECAYEDNGIISKFSYALEEFKFAVEHESWAERIDTIAALHFYIRLNDLRRAQSILGKYNAGNVGLAELIELYIDIFSSSLNHLDVISLADRIVMLSKSEASKLQYRMVGAVQHFMLKNSAEGEAKARRAIALYIEQPEENKSYYGNYRLAGAYKTLGEVIGDDSLVEEAIACYTQLLGEEGLRDEFLSELWYEIGDCYRSLKKLDIAEKIYRRSISISPKNIVKIFLAGVLIGKGEVESARSLLCDIKFSELNDHNAFDLAITWCSLATVTKGADDIEIALDMIKKVVSRDPYFMDLHRGLIIGMYELRSRQEAGKARTSLEKINSYITVNPSIFGIGVNFNAIISDLIRKKK